MKNLLLLTIVCLLVAGCNQNLNTLKGSIKEGLIVGNEVIKMERAKGHDSTADKIEIIVKQVQQVYDTNDISGNCPMLESTAEMGYQWVSEKYPQTLYPVMMALLKQRLSQYCSGEVVR